MAFSNGTGACFGVNLRDAPLVEAPLCRVNLLDQAVVVERGQRVTVWFVRLHDTWVRAKDHPDADLDEANSERRGDACPAGTVWRREIELRLPRGTLLRKTVSSPHVQQLSPVEYLTRGQGGTRRRLDESFHRVVGNYRLATVTQRPANARLH